MNRADKRRLARAGGNNKAVPFAQPQIGRFTVTPSAVYRALPIVRSGDIPTALKVLLPADAHRRLMAAHPSVTVQNELVAYIIDGVIAALPEVTRGAFGSNH
jgi:hypothetical protein